MFLNKPKIRTKTVMVKKAPTATAHMSSDTNGRPPLQKRTISGPPENRYQLTTRPRDTARQSLPVPRVPKRKASPITPQFDTSSESDSDDDDQSGKRRKTRPASSSIEPMNLNRTLEPDLKRRIRIQEPEPELNGTAAKKHQNGSLAGKKPVRKGSLVEGLAMSRGEDARYYTPAFSTSETNPILELQYPSKGGLERFEAVTPIDEREGYSPLEDIYFSIEEIIEHYLPPEIATGLSDDAEGIVRLLKRAVTKKEPRDFQDELAKFNSLIQEQLSNGTINRIIDDMHALPLNLVKRITAQSYNRIVSPHAHRLRKVKGKETTYGELLTPFVHKIFQQTGLNSSHVFVDLGSGVGNVVLQAALQTGAESWGIELMALAADLGAKQASELQARARLWNISLGDINLLQGDFLDSPAIDAVLRRADVVLVNNKVFGEKLNNELLQKFLDLKDGCKVVSLESFGGGKQGVRHEQAIAGLFDEERYESGTASVSWAGESVEYFIAEKVR